MYHIDANSYLQRARERLNEGRPESLFYAALELRCGIESRLREYLEAQEHIAKCRKSGWQIPKLAKNIERAFKLGNKITRVTMLAPTTQEEIASFIYTPVTSELQKNGQHLGNLLHALRRCRPLDDPWWRDTHTFLKKVAEQLALAASGTLLGPMIWNPKTGEAVMRHTLGQDEDPNSLMEKIGEIGTRLHIKVEYLEHLPEK